MRLCLHTHFYINVTYFVTAHIYLFVMVTLPLRCIACNIRNPTRLHTRVEKYSKLIELIYLLRNDNIRLVIGLCMYCIIEL